MYYRLLYLLINVICIQFSCIRSEQLTHKRCQEYAVGVQSAFAIAAQASIQCDRQFARFRF